MTGGSIKQWLARRVPGLQRTLHAVDGRTLARIEQMLAAQQRTALLADENGALLGGALAALDGREREGRFAWLGPAPYEATGIGRFSWECVRAAPIPVDYFCSAREPGRFLGWADLLARESEARMFPLSALARGVQNRSYSAILVSLGNSAHNLPVWRACCEIREWAPAAPVWLHIHDALLLDLAWLHLGEDSAAYSAALARAYGVERIGEREMSPADFPRLRAEAMLGARVLLAGGKFDRILVNSRRAADIIMSELVGDKLSQRVSRVFHPIFPAPEWRGPSDGVVRIASFGVPGAAKRTEVLIDACARLASSGTTFELVLAGYGVNAYLAGLRRKPQWLRSFDHPDTRTLEDLMTQCSLAVQLRAEDLGESSGVLAQLAAVGAPTIAGNVGAFADYADLFTLAPHDVDATSLASLIQSELGKKASRSAAQMRALRSPSAFWQALLSDNAPLHAV